MNIDEIRKRIRREEIKSSNHLSKFLIFIILTLVTLIILRSNPNIKKTFKEKVLSKNFSFAKINKVFKDKFGSPIPFSDKLSTEPVFSEKLEYKEASKYLDGVKLSVDKNYLVPNLKEGIVVFIGDKESYGNTVIIEGTDGVETWYSNVNTSLKLYDYLSSGSLIGEAKDDKIYLVFKKDDKILNYEKYI